MGGLGGGATETMVIMEEFGKALVVEPFIPTVVIGGGLLQRAKPAGAEALIGKIIEGDALIAFAANERQARYNLADIKTTARKDGDGYVLSGEKSVVIGAPWATHLIVTARTGGGQRETSGVSLFLVEKTAPGVSTRDYPTVDGRRASEVTFENVRVGSDALIGPEGQAWPLIEQVVDEAIAATCAEACGVLRRLHEGTLAYTKQRKQFGVPIASFQVLQHRMVDMFINLEQAVSMTYMANIRLVRSRGRTRQGDQRRQGPDRPRLPLRRPERHPAPRRHGHDRRDGHRPLLQARDDDRGGVREHGTTTCGATRR